MDLMHQQGVAVPVCGLVVTIDGDTDAPLRRLSGIAGVTVGDRAGQRLALVVESDDLAEEARRLEALSGVEGVCLVELAYADFSDVPREVAVGAHLLRRRRSGGHPENRMQVRSGQGDPR